jgi:hypothetical protein
MNPTAPFVLALFLLSGPQAPAKDRALESKLADSLAVMKDAASRYRFHADPGKGETLLIPDPLLRWSNPVAQEEDAGLFLWTRQGRPLAAAQFFVRKNLWMHEFQSLSESPFTVNWNGETIWDPKEAGLTFHVEPDSQPPEGSAVRRLRQMRTIAESFTASVEFQYENDSHYELRLLPRPLYRYGSAEGSVLDGTLWAFVQGTNPEVLLLVESRTAPDRTLRWNYAVAAMTSYPAEAKRKGKSVWKVGRQPIPTPEKRGPYIFRYDVPSGDRKPKGGAATDQ